MSAGSRPAEATAELLPKVTGTLALREVFGDLPLDFVLLSSSVTALAGGLGRTDDTAANAFLDAYARSPHGWRAPVLSVAWGAWREEGVPDHDGLAPDAAVRAARRALAEDGPARWRSAPTRWRRSPGTSGGSPRPRRPPPRR
ncbi:ketoreductase domain-containing protein [Micromonospora sp. BRA006-A]|nr:ketoreductase domain-containing protein [Micromonospora sp. BRA006-A]